MLKIREPQMKAFHAAMADEVCRATAADLRRSMPDATRGLDDADLLARVRAAMDRAPRYDMLAPSEMVGLAVIFVKYGLDADRTGGIAREVLRDPRLSPASKLAEIEARAASAKRRRS